MSEKHKKALARERSRPSQLLSPRSIHSTVEIDPLFWHHGTLALLLPNSTKMSTNLVEAGAVNGPEGPCIAYGTPIDFGVLDRFLPFVARKTIVPIWADLIPVSSWGSSLHNLLVRTCWNEIRERIFATTGRACETCGSRKQLECHELWRYYEPIPGTPPSGFGVQKLVQFLCLCALCHETHHLGRANVQGRLAVAANRLRAYNRWSDSEIKKYIDLIFRDWERRSQFDWVLDLRTLATIAVPLIVDDRWQLDKEGFLQTETKTGLSRTRILGVNWEHRGVTHAALSTDVAYIRCRQNC